MTLAAALAACASGSEAPGTSARDPQIDSSDPVTVDTSTRAARAQYDVDVAFAAGYTARCTDGSTGATARPRVLLTGFGRFGPMVDNATGRLVASIVPGLTYPVTAPPVRGAVDLPAEELAVASADIDLPGFGPVRICGMILPVYWDLASILIAHEIESFAPDMVLMNGVAGPRQPIWIELGGVNRAARLTDGSDVLHPATAGAALVESATASEETLGNLLSFAALRTAARTELAAIAAEDAATRTSPLAITLTGAIRTSYPRASNTYLCNNVTYTTNYLMAHSNTGTPITLLKASVPVSGKANAVSVAITRDVTTTPRGFVHWPSALDITQIPRAARVMTALLAAQLKALDAGESPSRGNNADADDTVTGGTTF